MAFEGSATGTGRTSGDESFGPDGGGGDGGSFDTARARRYAQIGLMGFGLPGMALGGLIGGLSGYSFGGGAAFGGGRSPGDGGEGGDPFGFSSMSRGQLQHISRWGGHRNRTAAENREAGLDVAGLYGYNDPRGLGQLVGDRSAGRPRFTTEMFQGRSRGPGGMYGYGASRGSTGRMHAGGTPGFYNRGQRDVIGTGGAITRGGGEGRMWAGGSPTFDESGGGRHRIGGNPGQVPPMGKYDATGAFSEESKRPGARKSTDRIVAHAVGDMQSYRNMMQDVGRGYGARMGYQQEATYLPFDDPHFTGETPEERGGGTMFSGGGDR